MFSYYIQVSNICKAELYLCQIFYIYIIYMHIDRQIDRQIYIHTYIYKERHIDIDRYRQRYIDSYVDVIELFLLHFMKKHMET